MGTSQKNQVLSFSIFIVLLAQISLDIFASNFRVSMGILLLPILVFLYQKISILPIIALAGSGVYLSRVLLHALKYEFSYQSLLDFFPELIFYYVYGCLFFLYFRKKDYKLPHDHCYIALFFMDYFGNLSELICRLRLDAFTPSLQINILLVALVRTVILWAVITGLSQYKFLLISAEHAHRYQRLILLISKLNSEIIWMQKNAVLIEDAICRLSQLYPCGFMVHGPVAFLQKDNITDNIGASVSTERIIRQTDGPQQIGTFCHVLAGGAVLAVHGVAAGDERHHAARPHLVYGLGKKVVVDAESQLVVRLVVGLVVAEGHVADR